MYWFPILILYIVSPAVHNLYLSDAICPASSESGFNLRFPHDAHFYRNQTQWINFEVSGKMRVNNQEKGDVWAYLIVPRSSISRTPLHLRVSPGVIDRDYTGQLIVPIYSDQDFRVRRGDSIAQIVFPTLEPFSVEIVNFKNKRQTQRGHHSFGSGGFVPTG